MLRVHRKDAHARPGPPGRSRSGPRSPGSPCWPAPEARPVCERRHRGLQSCEPDDGVQHQIGLDLAHQACGGVAARPARAAPDRDAGTVPAAAVRRPQPVRSPPETRPVPAAATSVSRRTDPTTVMSVLAGDHLQRLHADGAGRPEHEHPFSSRPGTHEPSGKKRQASTAQYTAIPAKSRESKRSRTPPWPLSSPPRVLHPHIPFDGRLEKIAPLARDPTTRPRMTASCSGKPEGE